MARGITGVGVFGQLGATARVLVPELSFLQGAARFYWLQVIGNDVPFYDQASLGGEVLFRGFHEDRFIDMGAWEVEVEQRLKLFQTHIFGVVADWRIDPFVAAGQVYGDDLALVARARRGRRRACGCGSTPTSSDASIWPTAARVCGRTSFLGIHTESYTGLPPAMAGAINEDETWSRVGWSRRSRSSPRAPPSGWRCWSCSPPAPAPPTSPRR